MNKTLNIFSFISVVGTLVWVSTDFYGGMVIYGLMYWWLIVPVVLGYGITFFVTLSQLIHNGYRSNLFGFSTHAVGISVLSAFTLYHSEIFKSEVILEAILIDDLSNITIELRENRTFDTTVNGLFGYVDRISGTYHLEEDTILFHKPPYSNDFIPNKILIDKSDSALYFKKLPNGEFDRTKGFVNYFEIRKIKL